MQFILPHANLWYTIIILFNTIRKPKSPLKSFVNLLNRSTTNNTAIEKGKYIRVEEHPESKQLPKTNDSVKTNQCPVRRMWVFVCVCVCVRPQTQTAITIFNRNFGERV